MHVYTDRQQEIEEEDAKLWKSIYEFKQLMNNVHDIAYIRVLNQIYFLFHTPERAAQELKLILLSANRIQE